MYQLKIKEVRESKEITQREIAKALDMTQQQYHKIENNVNVPGIDKLVRIAKYLNVSIEDLIVY